MHHGFHIAVSSGQMARGPESAARSIGLFGDSEERPAWTLTDAVERGRRAQFGLC